MNFNTHKTIDISVYEIDSDSTLTREDFTAVFDKYEAKCPPNATNKGIKLELDYADYSDNQTLKVYFTYVIPKTQEDYAQEEARKRDCENWEKQQYLALKKKYGD